MMTKQNNNYLLKNLKQFLFSYTGFRRTLNRLCYTKILYIIYRCKQFRLGYANGISSNGSRWNPEEQEYHI